MYFFKCTFENLLFWSYFSGMKFSFGYQAGEENWHFTLRRSKSGDLAAIPYGLEKISSQAHYNKEEYKYRLYWCKKNTFSTQLRLKIFFCPRQGLRCCPSYNTRAGHIIPSSSYKPSTFICSANQGICNQQLPLFNYN